MCMPSHLDAIDEMLFYSALHIILCLQNFPSGKKNQTHVIEELLRANSIICMKQA